MSDVHNSTATTTDTKAADLAALAAELVNSAETSARQEVARRIGAMLLDIANKSAPEPPQLPEQIKKALLEAQLMSESVYNIVYAGLKEDGALEFPMLQAIMACLQRMDAAIEPAIERLKATAQ